MVIRGGAKSGKNFESPDVGIPSGGSQCLPASASYGEDRRKQTGGTGQCSARSSSSHRGLNSDCGAASGRSLNTSEPHFLFVKERK